MPNFLIIGAAKAGTTSLYHYLRQHPQVYMSEIKETNFFCYDSSVPAPSEGNARDHRDLYPVRSLEDYRAIFSGARQQHAVGEASPQYFHVKGVADRIHGCLSDAKLIAVLRHPVERAYSSYLMYVRDGIETRSFGKAVRDEQQGRNHNLPYGQWNYIRAGLYRRLLEPYFNYFDRRQIGLFLYDDLRRNPLQFVQSIHRFLEVDEAFKPNVRVHYNPSGTPRSRFLHGLLGKRPLTTALKSRMPAGVKRMVDLAVTGLHRFNLENRPLAGQLRKDLIKIFYEDVQKLENLMNRDLSAWLK